MARSCRLVIVVLAATACVLFASEDWPAYRADASRSAYTPQGLPAGLALRWTYEPAHPPVRAWPGDPRLDFDTAPQVVAGGGAVYFGSSADGKVYALDAETGKPRWTFVTGAPVRFAPALAGSRVFAASDDGFLYALESATGKLAWSRRLAPSDRLVLGNGRLISKWPVRGGPVVDAGTVYAGAGIWPTEGVYLTALAADTGEPQWTNAEAGFLKMNQPHGAGAKSGVSIQGYLALAGERLLVPAGRGPYASFARAGGKFQYHRLGEGWSYGSFGPTLGGSRIAVAGDLVIQGALHVCRVSDGGGDRFRGSGLDAATAAVAPDRIYFWNGRALAAVERAAPFAEVERNGKKEKTLNAAWSVECPGVAPVSLMVAGSTALLGGKDAVTAVDLNARKVAWSLPVKGTAHGLAAAGGRLLVSTDAGTIYCFAAGGQEALEAKAPSPQANPYGAEAGAFDAGAAAEEVLKLGGIREGYALDLGCGDGRLLYELARRSSFYVVGLESDPALVARARERLDAAGLLGVRAAVVQGDPDRPALPNYFADLVLSSRSAAGGAAPNPEALRCQRPYGGVACFGKPGAMTKSERGPLSGAGSWTHQYADAAQTSCSNDERLKGPLTVLWFGGASPDGSEQEIPSRHGRPPAPLFAEGRLFAQGIDDVRAYDAYNGRELWRVPLPGIGKRWHSMPKIAGVAASGSNFCTDKEIIYATHGERCERIDARTGRLLDAFPSPGGPWGYVACSGGVLLGAIADEAVLLSGKLPGYAKEIFALDPASGKLLWRYAAQNAIRINAISAGSEVVYVIDRPVAPADAMKPGKGEEAPEHPGGTLLAFDLRTGRERWRRTEGVFGTMLVLDEARGILLQCYQTGIYLGIRSELGGRLSAFRASDGQPLYDVKADYGLRPVAVDGTVIGGTGAWDLETGALKKAGLFVRSYGCGAVSASRNLLAFRSGCVGYFDLSRSAGTESFGGIRPGCWLNILPAGGLLLVPNYSLHCSCSYQMRTAVALEPAP